MTPEMVQIKHDNPFFFQEHGKELYYDQTYSFYSLHLLFNFS